VTGAEILGWAVFAVLLAVAYWIVWKESE